jgi:hypothetical protein
MFNVVINKFVGRSSRELLKYVCLSSLVLGFVVSTSDGMSSFGLPYISLPVLWVSFL